jgi:hypothetical protein
MFDLLGEGIVGEVYSGQFGIVRQRIDDQFKIRSGCGLSGRRHNGNGLFRSEGMD